MPLAKDKESRAQPASFKLSEESRQQLARESESMELTELADELTTWNQQDPHSRDTVQFAGDSFTIGDERAEVARLLLLRAQENPDRCPGSTQALKMLKCKTLYVRGLAGQGTVHERSMPVEVISPQIRTATSEHGTTRKLFFWVRATRTANEQMINHLRSLARAVDDEQHVFCLSPASLALTRPSQCPGDIEHALSEFVEWNSAAPDFNTTYRLSKIAFKVGQQRQEVAHGIAATQPSYTQLMDKLSLLRSSYLTIRGGDIRVRMVIPLMGQREQCVDYGKAGDDKGDTVSPVSQRRIHINELLWGVQLDEDASAADHQKISSLSEHMEPATRRQQTIYFLRRHLLQADNDGGKSCDNKMVDSGLPAVPDTSTPELFTSARSLMTPDHKQHAPADLEPPVPVGAPAQPTDSSQPLLRPDDPPPAHAPSSVTTPPAHNDDAPGESPCCIVS